MRDPKSISDTPAQDFLFEFVAEVPQCPDDYEFVTASVSSDGRGLFLYTRDLAKSGVFGANFPNGARFPKATTPNLVQYRLLIVSADTAYFVCLPPTDIAYPMVDLLSDGRVLLAGARSEWRGPDDFDRNGAIIDVTTGAVSRILLGDGIQDIAIDEQDRIWVAYFDEGVLGNRCWPMSQSLGAGGLVCLTEDGEKLWNFNSGHSSEFILDCYALGTSDGAVWAYYHSDFRLFYVDANFRTTFVGPMPISGACSVAISDNAVVMGPEYDDPADRFYLLPRNGDTLGAPKPLRGQIADGAHPKFEFTRTNVMGRDHHLHVIGEYGWFRADVTSIKV